VPRVRVAPGAPAVGDWAAPKVLFLSSPNSSHAMKIIVGLGNPGIKYRRTRHNIGFMVVGELAKRRAMKFRRGRFQSTQARGKIGKEEVFLVRPMTFMNRSGITAAGIAKQHGCALDDLLVVCDDVNLELGRLRLRRSGSDGGHKGLKSVIQHLDGQKFPRLRLGIDRPPGDMDIMTYVLGVFRRGEWPAVRDMVERGAQAVETWIYHGIDEAMNRYNESRFREIDNL